MSIDTQHTHEHPHYITFSGVLQAFFAKKLQKRLIKCRKSYFYEVRYT